MLFTTVLCYRSKAWLTFEVKIRNSLLWIQIKLKSKHTWITETIINSLQHKLKSKHFNM